MDNILVFQYVGDWGGGLVFVDKDNQNSVDHYTKESYNKKDYLCLGTLREFSHGLIETKRLPKKRGINQYAIEDFVVIE